MFCINHIQSHTSYLGHALGVAEGKLISLLGSQLYSCLLVMSLAKLVTYLSGCL